MTFSLIELLCHLLQILGLIVGIKRTVFQTSPTVYVAFAVCLHDLTYFRQSFCAHLRQVRPSARSWGDDQQLFYVFTVQRNILGVANVRWYTGSIYNHNAAVSSGPKRIFRVIVILGFYRFCLPFLRILQNYFINFSQCLRYQTLTEVHHQRWVNSKD